MKERDYYKGIVGIYFKNVMRNLIKLGELEKEKQILDFGCGLGYLKKTLKNKNVINYDIEPEYTETENYRHLKPSCVVCSHLLEHLELTEIINLLNDFKDMKINKLVTALPTENIISKIGMIFTGFKGEHDDHKTKIDVINKLLLTKFILIRRKKIFTMSEISVWEERK